ncbi:hypothetical protein DPMN_117666 [Dreissena polymorpha]|uniref:Uncharacterized protein n=1 Tax=Dreissena polymorpha TaxID=45954 RepID=A0A9D4JQF1_DREPO|nr:hypothetical protein DPMN_117666 [Dreissena polymorpha]
MSAGFEPAREDPKRFSVYKPNVDGRTDDGQRPILKPHLSNQANKVTSRVKTAPTPWRPYINKTNFFTKFHDDWTKNVTSRRKLPRPLAAIFELVRDINKTNVLTKFNDDWANTVTSKVFTRKTAPPTGGHVFQRTGTTFELNQHIIKINILTNFKLDRGIIEKNLLTKFHEDRTRNSSRVFTRKTARPAGRHVFQRTGTTFELEQHIIETNILTNFKLEGGIISTNLPTKFHEDPTKNVASRVFTASGCGGNL